MHELIQITTDSQGGSVVSARELHEFLEVKTKFSTWISQRIKDFDFVAGKHFTTFTENLENGGRTIEYALSLSMAKELSMVERTQKGKQARQYFIECEETLRELATQPAPALLSTEQVLLQLVSQSQHLLANQQAQLVQLRADMNAIMNGQQRPRSPVGRQLPLPGLPAPVAPPSLRLLISRKVNEYCGRYGAEQRDTYRYLYKRLFYVFGVDVDRLPRKASDSKLDAIERSGHLERLYSLITSELNVPDEL